MFRSSAWRHDWRWREKIFGNIEIGACSLIAAGSVVLHPVPPNTTMAGAPARAVGTAGCAEPLAQHEPNLEPAYL